MYSTYETSSHNQNVQVQYVYHCCLCLIFVFLLLARFHARPIGYKALILAFTTKIFEWNGCNTHQRGLPVDVHNNNNRYLTDLAEILHVVLFWGPYHDSTSKPPSCGNGVLFFWATRYWFGNKAVFQISPASYGWGLRTGQNYSGSNFHIKEEGSIIERS